MGLFDFLKSKDAAPKQKSAKELVRLSRIVGSKLSQDYDRQEAIRTLADMANAEGAKLLLKRFDFTMEPSITDRDEKEAALAGIVGAGEAAIPPILAYCSTAESLTWPLKALAEIVDAQRLVDELLELLEQFDTEYVRNSQPKLQIIQLLEEHPSEDVRLATELFLRDVNEGVRFTAATTVFAANNAASVPSFIDALADEESLRVKNRIASGLVETAWPLTAEQIAAFGPVLPPGYIAEASGVKRV